MSTKAIIDFEDYTASELSPAAQAIHDSLVTNVATYATPPVTVAALQTLITSYDQKLVARTSKAKADIIAFNTARGTLEDALTVLGNYVNSLAQGDAAKVQKSGFPSYTTGVGPDNSPPDAPQDLRLKHGELSGTITARYKPDRRSSTNEVQVNLTDPNTESAWVQKGLFQGGRAELSGLTPGTLVWVRVRTVGLKGVMGAWSDPAQIRVL